jgi:putative phage-type endonuclease
MKHHKVEQNTDEWMQLRSGKFTASAFKDLFMKETTATYRNAIYKAVFEKVTGEAPESFSNEYMQRGHELEPFARKQYEVESFNTVEDAGFFELNEWVGASPDGLIGSDGIVEIKCPAYSTMIQYLIDQKLPNQYKWQVYGQLWVTGRKWCDFMAYHPKLKPVIIRIKRDEIIIGELITKVESCIDHAKRVINIIK